jgi:hypothetical protein
MDLEWPGARIVDRLGKAVLVLDGDMAFLDRYME